MNPRRLGALLAAVAIALASAFAIGINADATEQAASTQNAITEPLEFRSESSLEEHFRKHGSEVGAASVEEYLTQANEVIVDPDSLHKTQQEDGDDVYFRPSTGEIVIVSPYGRIRTYFITDFDYYDRQ